MLKKKALNRIFITSIVFFIVFVFCSLNLIEQTKKIYKINNYNIDYKEAIYTLNKDNYISKTYVYVEKELTTLEKVKILLETMITKNNKNALLPSYFSPMLPQNTKIISVELENKLLKINFSKEFLNVTEDQSEQLIEALTYTLTSIDDVIGIELYVENSLLKYVPNTTKELPTVLTKEYGINKKYEIVNNKNINKVIVYFLGENNNYIPVTKYLNDEREKIEIIIETLTKDYVFYENLVSVLNYNLVLEDYELNENSINLVFNDYIYENNVLNEEAINLICYSVFDNYDVNKVIFVNKNINILEKNRKDA